jgi:hypothetical protein
MSGCKGKYVKGGDGVAEYGVKVFGGPGEQHAVEGTNVIAMNVVKGGKGKKTRKKDAYIISVVDFHFSNSNGEKSLKVLKTIFDGNFY